MSKKPVISIDVDDTAFKRFYDLFQKYEEKVTELPAEWKQVDEAISGAGRGFHRNAKQTQTMLAGMAAATATIAEAINHANKAQRDFEATTKRSHSSMLKLGHAAKGVAGTVFGMGKWLMKWGTLGGATLGIGGSIGLDDLANAAMSRQRTARGLGMTPGQNAAFSTYFNQFGNTDGIAANVANARNNVSDRWIFSSLGIGNNALARDSNFQLDQTVMQRMQRVLQKLPRSEWANYAQAYGLTNLADLQTLRVLRHTSTGRMDAARAGATASVGALGFSPAVAREWTDLQIQMRKAGVQIETSLITGLHRLAPELTIISRDIAHWISAFATGPQMGKIVNEVENGLKVFAKFLASPEFGKDLHRLQSEIGTAASEIAAIAKGIYPYAKAAGWVAKKTVQGADAVGHAAGAAWHATEQGYRDVRHYLGMGNHNPGNIRHRNQFGAWELNRYPTEHAGMRAMANLLQSYPAKHHADTIASIIPIWNGHGANDPEYIRNVARWSGYRPNQPLDLSNRTVRDHLMAAMIRQEHSDKVTPAQVQASLNSHHALPAHVSRLVDTLRKQRAATPTKVIIQNQTAARIAVQANAAAY